jgi:hypothetical protein
MIFIQEQQAMDDYLSRLMNESDVDIDTVRFLFLEQFPGKEDYMETYINDFLS